MSSKSETGNAQNVANIEDLISVCSGYGTDYNPSNQNLTIPSLQTLQTTCINILQTVKEAVTQLNNATNSREIAFKPFKKLATKIINSLDSTDATTQTVNDARTINRKIQGIRAPKKTKSIETPESISSGELQTISTAQLSYDSLIDHFTKLIQTISTEPLYKPNETELKVTTLKTLLTTLKTLNTAVINATTTHDNALISRDKILYQPITGLIDITIDAKKYVKSVFGTTSQQYKQISSIKFKKRKI